MQPLRTLATALRAVLILPVRRPPRLIGPGDYWLAFALLVAALIAESAWLVPAPRATIPYALHGAAFIGLVALALAAAFAALLRRPALAWPIAALLVATQLWIEVLTWPVEHWALPASPLSERAQHDAARNLWIVLTLLSLRRVFDHLAGDRSVVARSVLAIALGLAFLAPLMWVPPLPWFHPDPAGTQPEADPEATEHAPIPGFDPERVMARQDRLVDAALESLAPQRPGVVDLYVVALAGDGSERVFRNEVEYVERLFSQRFDAAGRVVTLINAADTVEETPLATRRNLRRALRGLGARIDRDEDLVLLFLTTHGSEDHALYVALDALPLRQLDPGEVAEALDDAGIASRIVVVSACYSGGFIPALAGPHSLVVTAARADRTSFGCGTWSDFTYFGRAYFIGALNETTDFVAAFERAEALIAEWEREEELERSHPQISRAAALESRLERWRETLPPSPAVPFDPPPRVEARER